MLEFLENGPPHLSRVPFAFNPPQGTMASLALEWAVTNLIQKVGIEPVVDSHLPGFYNHLFLVHKRYRRDRPVIDLSYLNKYIDVDSFKMETMSSIP